MLDFTSQKAAERILEQLGIIGADLIERTPDDSHLSEVEKVVVLEAQTIKSCVLSGKAARASS